MNFANRLSRPTRALKYVAMAASVAVAVPAAALAHVGPGVRGRSGGHGGQPLHPIYLNRAYSPTERAADLVSRMTLAEKAAQMNSSRPPAIPRLGVAAWGWWNESNHGVNALTVTPTGKPLPLDQHHVVPVGPIHGQHAGTRPRLPRGRHDRRRGPRGRAGQHREPRLLRADGEPVARPAVGPQR